MTAAGVVRGEMGIHAFDLAEPRISQTDEMLVRVREVGLGGTDFRDYHEVFATRGPDHIKTLIEISPQ